jgi:hypothetical protein
MSDTTERVGSVLYSHGLYAYLLYVSGWGSGAFSRDYIYPTREKIEREALRAAFGRSHTGLIYWDGKGVPLRLRLYPFLCSTYLRVIIISDRTFSPLYLPAKKPADNFFSSQS